MSSALAGRATTLSPPVSIASYKSNTMAPKTLGRLRIRLNRARNLKGPEILGMSNCLVVFTFEGKREESSVKVNDIAPVWNEEITFENVAYPPASKVAITIVYRSGKKDEVLGVAAPGQNLWTTGNQVPADRWLPIATKEGIYAGELNFHLHWTKTEVRYRKPVQLLQKAAAKTSVVTRAVDPYLDKALAGVATLAKSTKAKVSYLSRAQKGVLLAALAAIATAMGATVLVPAIIFFPVTFVLVGGFLCGSVVAFPLILLATWVLLCAQPVQTRVVTPLAERLLEINAFKTLLTLD